LKERQNIVTYHRSVFSGTIATDPVRKQLQLGLY